MSKRERDAAIGKRLILGCATFGREIGAAESHALMDHAVARGIGRFDTARAYSDGASERIVGEWVAAHPGEAKGIEIATKQVPPLTPEAVFSAANDSRERLRRDTIDIWYVHKWDPTTEDLRVLEGLDRLVREGVARRLGASNFNAEQLERVIGLQKRHGLAPFSIVQNNHNLAVRSVDAALKRVCTEHRIEIVTYSPLGAGFLTGKHRGGVAAGSRFELIPGHQRVYFNDLAGRRLAHLLDVSGRSGFTPTQLALAWVLQQPGIDAVLVGGRNTSHIDQAFSAAALDVGKWLSELDAE